jgi:hypothetical protein
VHGPTEGRFEHWPAPWVAVDACTLPSGEQPLRVTEFDELFAASVRDIVHPPGSRTRTRLVLAGDAALPARVQRLADAETACCSFFTFTLTSLDTDRAGETVVALDIEVPAARSDVLAALVQRAAQASKAPS